MGRAVRPNERERMSQSVHWRISYLLTVNGTGKTQRPPSRSPPSSLNAANGMSDPSTQRYAVASIEGPSRTGISDEGRSEVRAGLALRAANQFQNGNKVKQLRPGPTGHRFRGTASGATRKNRTWETCRLARSIRDVAFASRREFVAEARPRCGSGDRLTWTQPFARQAQFFWTNHPANLFIRNRCSITQITVACVMQ